VAEVKSPRWQSAAARVIEPRSVRRGVARIFWNAGDDDDEDDARDDDESDDGESGNACAVANMALGSDALTY